MSRRTPARDLVLSTTRVPTMMLRVFRMHLRGRRAQPMAHVLRLRIVKKPLATSQRLLKHSSTVTRPLVQMARLGVLHNGSVS